MARSEILTHKIKGDFKGSVFVHIEFDDAGKVTSVEISTNRLADSAIAILLENISDVINTELTKTE